jgi:hypothetical protein
MLKCLFAAWVTETKLLRIHRFKGGQIITRCVSCYQHVNHISMQPTLHIYKLIACHEYIHGLTEWFCVIRMMRRTFGNLSIKETLMLTLHLWHRLAAVNVSVYSEFTCCDMENTCWAVCAVTYGL